MVWPGEMLAPHAVSWGSGLCPLYHSWVRGRLGRAQWDSQHWGQGQSLTLFEPWTSLAAAAVEGAGLTHYWGMDRAALQ